MMPLCTGMAGTDNYSGMIGRYIQRYNNRAAAGTGLNSKDIVDTEDIANNNRYCKSDCPNS